MNNNKIECISLNKQYKGRNVLITAVRDVSLKIEKGEFILLKGRSGAGKSTLLNLIGGLIAPTSGKVTIDGFIVNQLDNKSLSNLLLNRVGIVFQGFNLLPTYDIYENIEVALAPRGLSKREIKKLAIPYFERFGLSEMMHLLPEELSTGQQQKVAVIRTLIRQPSIILADEPTASIDDIAAGEILELMRNLCNEQNVTIILATHGIVPETIADRMIVMENGKVINQ